MILKALTVVKGTRSFIGVTLHDLERIWHLRPFPLILGRNDMACGGVQPWMTGTTKTPEERIGDYPSLKEILGRDYVPVWGNDLFQLLERK